MPHIPVLKPRNALKEVSRIYEEFYTQMGFLSAPNFIMTQGHSLTVATGTWRLVQNVLVRGKIPRWTKEMIFVAISKDRGCKYCLAAHSACCRVLGVKPKLLADLVTNPRRLLDEKLRAIILFALKASRKPQSLGKRDYEILRRHGLTRAEIVELIAMSAFAVYANILADATAMEPDEIFDRIA